MRAFFSFYYPNTNKLKHLFFILLLTFSVLYLNAQVTTSPALPIDTDEVLITFNATQATNKSLLNYTGDLYVHTGVKVEGNTEWQYVIGSWGNNTDQPKLTRTGNNTYILLITPSIREYYSVPTDKKITQMCFVFRSADGSLQSEDIFCTVYEDGLSVSITSPNQTRPIFELNDTISVNVASNNATGVSLYIDNFEVTSTTELTISHSYIAKTYGKHWFKAVATDSTSTQADSVYVLIRAQIAAENLPSGLHKGVNIVNDNTATIVLYEPNATKEYVYLIGTFSNWLADEQYQMKRTPDGKYFWLTLNNLSANTEYGFQFLVDGYLRIADPYTNKTLDPNDEYIEPTTYPNLMEYPKEETSGIASVFSTKPQTYSWQTTNFEAPKKEKLVVYELHVRDFVSDSYIGTVTDSIRYLKRLGVTAIELMPFNEFEGNDSWGYNPSFYFAPDKYYGTPSDYKAFIDEAHANGIAVIMDIVLNHSFGQSPLVQLYSTSDGSSLGTPTEDNPWYNVTSPNTDYSWGYDFNHESDETKAFVDSVLTYWLTEYKIDGFRFDFTKGFTNTVGNGWNYDATRIAILKRIADAIWDVNPDAYVILEHLCDNSEEKVLAAYGMLLWGNMNSTYNEATMGWVGTSNFSDISYKQRNWTVPNLVGYMESHDEERLMYKNITYGNSTNSNHDVKDIDIGVKRVELAANFFIPIPGPKMIWQFGELGYDVSIDKNGRTGRKPLHWEYYCNSSRNKLYNTMAHLNKLKQNYEVFSTSNFTSSLSGAKKWIKLDGTDMDVVILGNFDVNNVDFTIEFPSTGKWYEYFTQDSIDVTETSVTFNAMEPAEYRFYTSVKISKDQVHTGIANDVQPKSRAIVYPNPNSGIFNIKVPSNSEQILIINVYNSVGQLIYSVNPQVGTTQIALPESITSGIYIYNIQGVNNRQSGKIVVHR